MKEYFENKINGYGAILRFITPVLISALGYFLITGQDRIDRKLDYLDSHFTNHLAHHQELEIGYEKRLTELKTKVDVLPPQWMVDKINDLDKRIR